MMRGLPTQIASLRRSAWRPRVEEVESAAAVSKFGGSPYLLPGEAWPACQHCGQIMPLLLQLNFAELPPALRDEFGEGLLQLFYCVNADAGCEDACEAFSPFSEGKLTRIITPDGEPATLEPADAAAIFPARRILGWDECDDYPNWDEASALGVEYTEDDARRLSDDGFPRPGDKLSGWPYWVQGIEYPRCRLCDTEMRLIFQLDSEDHLPYMFGDTGCGHVTQCPVHKAEVTFAWACC